MNAVNIQGVVFEPVGTCIFCGSDGGEDGLRDEHIIPYSLSGNAILPKSSCTDCEKITSYLDGYLARHVFYDFRIHANTQTRRPRERPVSRHARISIGEGAEFELSLPIDEHPFLTVLPSFGQPGVLSGTAPDGEYEFRRNSYHYIPPDFHEKLGVDSEEDVRVHSRGAMSISVYCRALAKIAYCHCVASYGLSALDPLTYGGRPVDVTEVILGNFEHPRFLVGGDGDLPPPPATGNSMHLITFATLNSDDTTLLAAYVRLFANSGADEMGFPIYEVVLGHPAISLPKNS